ncbi:MAG TPA: ABC transporter permease [Bryobacteraceae bacterium]|nr:ABC transporter permease [Bryobacteraceae bacterium]
MPDWKHYVTERLSRLSVRPEREHEIASELAQQLEQAYSDALAEGRSEKEALQRAEAQFPDWAVLRRDINAAELRSRPTGFLQDFRFAARLLRTNPAFTVVAVLTLAFGIGANTAIFTVVDTLALRNLPYDSPAQLMAIESYQPRQPEIEPWAAALDFFDLRSHLESFTDIAAISPIWNVVYQHDGQAERLEPLYVSASFFPMLGVQPAVGRAFLESEDQGTKPSHVVVLSHSFWMSHFNGSPSAVGQVMSLDGTAYTVVGVLPQSFRYLGEPVAGTATNIDLWMPLSDNQIIGTPRSVRFLKMVGRRKPGVSEQQARDELRRAGAGLAAQFPASNRGVEFDAKSLTKAVQGRLRPTMLLLLGAVGFVLLMACANVAQLLLVRGAGRAREISVRIALGASGWRLIRQLVTEGIVLALVGGAAGILLAFATLRLLVATGPPAIFQTHAFTLDGQVLGFTVLIIFLSAILSGLPPAWRILAIPVADALRETGRGVTAASRRLRSTLVVTQVAIAFALLIGAGLLIHSFLMLLRVNPGFTVENAVTLTTQLPPSALPREKRIAVYKLIRERLMAMPGVQDVGTVSRLPLMGQNLGTTLWIEGRPMVRSEATPDIEYRVATPTYFTTMGIPLEKGRLFDERDDSDTFPVILINEAAARKLWPGEDPVGKRVKLGPDPSQARWITIVGVVGSVRHFGLEVDPRPEIYRPYAASPLSNPILIVRTSADPGPLISSFAAAVRSVNAAMPVYNVFRLQELVDRSTLQRRFVMIMLLAFALLSVVLACIGIYGAASQSVVQRTQEIGLRMALGASPSSALGLVLGESARLLVAGIVLGSLLALALLNFVRSLLFGIQPLDPAAFLLAALALSVITLFACYLPARRATLVDPLIALRHE